jgi:two-component system sensor histidine kinase KdpD
MDMRARSVLGRPQLVAVATSAGAVALITLLIYGLKHFVPVLSLGSLYVFAVLPIAIVYGLGYALFVAVASMLAYEFFFLSPLYTFEIEDWRSWFALFLFASTAVVVSELASRARRRASEAELLAEVAASMLERGEVSGQLDAIAADAARALGAERVRIEIGPAGPPVAEDDLEQEIVAGDHQVGRIVVAGRRRRFGSARLLSGLASLLAVAIEHERLTEEAYQAEALRRSDAVKTAIIQAASHDLRTPLATIETALGSLQDPDLRLEEVDRAVLLEAIAVEHARLKRLVENLLELSRLQAGAIAPVPEFWTAEQLLVDALDEVEDADRVQVVISPNLPVVRVDGVQIQRVLVNLLENALKFSSSAAPVQLRANPSHGEVVIRVTNHGPGIPESELGRIFEPFQRVAGERTRGAGLGLAIAKGFTEANGGRIWAESKPGQGATLVVVLPAVESPALVSA